MARWIVRADASVTYQVAGKPDFQCGKAESGMLPEVLAWVITEAKPWDIIQCPLGTEFVKQVIPAQ